MKTVLFFRLAKALGEGAGARMIRDAVFSANIVQGLPRRAEVRTGNLLLHLHAPTPEQRTAVVSQVHLASVWREMEVERLQDAAAADEVFAWTIGGLDETVARQINTALESRSDYLGMLGFHDDDAMYRLFIEMMLVPTYEIAGRSCEILQVDEDPLEEITQLGRLGFAEVTLGDAEQQLRRA